MITGNAGVEVRESADELTFHDHLDHWMSRAPWLAISAAAHVIVLLILTVFPWEVFHRPEQPIVQARIEVPAEAISEEPPPEEFVEPEPVTIDDAEFVELAQSEFFEVDVPSAFNAGSESAFAALDFVSSFSSSEIGLLGAPPGGWPPSDGTGPPSGTGARPRTTPPDFEPTIDAGLAWLARHRSPSGGWDCDGFADDALGCSGECDMPGEAPHDVGVTGLAVLAFLGNGHTTRAGEYRETVARAVRWLVDQQDADSGLLGPRLGHSYLYNHAIGTLALCEVYYVSKSPLLRPRAQLAVNFITTARNPYGAWRYDAPPTGDNDTSVTGWMVFALKSAEEAGLRIDPDAYRGALGWFAEVTDPASGRAGYDAVGTASSRIDGVNDHYPTDKGEAMTAVALLCRIFLDDRAGEDPLVRKQSQLLLARLPEWDQDGFGCDMYYWYYGTYAMYQLGGAPWTKWSNAMQRAILPNQRKDGDLAGSWDPLGPWGFSGGRIYSTATMVLCLEVYYRYARVLGAR